jgi:hypothetical protein
MSFYFIYGYYLVINLFYFILVRMDAKNFFFVSGYIPLYHIVSRFRPGQHDLIRFIESEW